MCILDRDVGDYWMGGWILLGYWINVITCYYEDCYYITLYYYRYVTSNYIVILITL